MKILENEDMGEELPEHFQKNKIDFVEVKEDYYLRKCYKSYKRDRPHSKDIPYRLVSKEYIKEIWWPKFYRENKDKILEKNKKWVEENMEKAREYHKQWCLENADKCRASSRKSYRKKKEENPDFFKIKQKLYAEKNREKMRAYCQRYRDNKKRLKEESMRNEIE